MTARLLPDWPALMRVIDRRLPADYLHASGGDPGAWYWSIVEGWADVGLLARVVATAWPGAPGAAVWLQLAAEEAGYRLYRPAVDVLDDDTSLPALEATASVVDALAVRPGDACSTMLDLRFERDGALLWGEGLGDLAGRALAADIARAEGGLIVALGGREWRDRARIGGLTTTGRTAVVVVMDSADRSEQEQALWHELGHRLDSRLRDRDVSAVELERFADAVTPLLAAGQPSTIDECAAVIEAGERARAGLRCVSVPGWPAWWEADLWWPLAFGGQR
ncbi:MAG: hypothetical protein AB7G23_20090 [Vicinamibacterales bacterium]